MIETRNMTNRDLDAVVRIHVERFPEARSTAFGAPFVRRMYRWFVANYPDLAYVALDGDRIVGIAAGSIGGYGRLVFRSSLPQLALGVLKRPGLLVTASTFQLWTSYLRAFLPARRRRAVPGGREPEVMAALGSIASSNTAPSGVGSALLERFEAAAWDRGATLASLSVLARNVGARAFYERRGWTLDYATATSAGYSKRNPLIADRPLPKSDPKMLAATALTES